MQLLKRIVASSLVGMLLISNTQLALAINEEGHLGQTEQTRQINNESVETKITSGIDDLGVQLDDLYHEVGKSLNIDYMYVKIIHIVSGGKAVYADKRPNIYCDLTVDTLNEPFEIKGSKQISNKEAPWAYCPDPSIVRPSKYYLPDAAYNTTADIVKIMNSRYSIDRGNMQLYFDALKKEVKTNILFCEAMLQYTGASSDEVNNFYRVYEKLIYDKETNENVIVALGNGEFEFKEEFKQIFIDNGISSDESLHTLSIILSFDKNLAASDDPNTLKEKFVSPYKIGYTSRENLMTAAMSIVGKVRYVWGGGHLGAGHIEGINPVWKEFYNSYGTELSEEGYQMCVKPNTSWCPLHGKVETVNGCLLESETVYSAKEYVNTIKDIVNIKSEEDIDKYEQLFSSIDDTLKHGLTSHRLDGLDCAGYIIWAYSQIDRTNTYSGGASNIINQSGMKQVEIGSRLLPGDVFAWSSHVILIVGPAREGSDAYVMLEASPNTVKFGVAYYSSSSKSDRKLAKDIAIEANKLFGGLQEVENANSYNMDTIGYYRDTVITSDDGSSYMESVQLEHNTASIGRLNRAFIDENTVIPNYSKKIIDMDAKEIIQHTLSNMSEQYISGLSTYDGNEFSLPDTTDTQKSNITSFNEELSNEIEELNIEVRIDDVEKKEETESK